MNRKQTLQWLEIKRLGEDKICSRSKYFFKIYRFMKSLKIGLLRK